MPTVETISVTLPADVLAHAREFAQKDQKSLDETVAEALRQYEKKRWWDNMNAARTQPAPKP